ncbi:S1 family peptidase [Streptomyces melanogenes]|uniref:S1 family peptidase n=1 Tax=Streptomyces melanogenes TaxID=67326 RepID=UPI0037A0EC25
MATPHLLRGLAAAVAASCLAVGTATAAAPPPAALQAGMPLTAGWGGRCVSGFNLRSADLGFIMASGSCGKVADVVRGPGNVFIGQVVAVSRELDTVLIRVDNNDEWQQGPWVSSQSPAAPPYVVTGSREAHLGATVRMSSANSGILTGTVTATGLTVNTPDGTMTGLTRATLCSSAGDSGAPVSTTDGQAQGYVVLASGSGDCDTLYMPIGRTLDTYHVQVMTGQQDDSVTR